MVGKQSGVLLPVAQFKESHDCDVDLSLIVGTGATVVAPPYQAMSVGDKVKLTLKRFFDDDTEFGEYTREKTLTRLDIGRPVQWLVPLSELQFIENGSALMSYRIVYANPTVPTDSREQALRIVTPQAPLLPAPRVKDFTGDMLDPEAYPDGLVLVIEIYPGIQVDDEVVLYAWGDPRAVKTVRIDQSTIDSQLLEFSVDHDWLTANNGKMVELVYQYAREGNAGTSMPLSLMLRRPLYLPHPIIDRVVWDGEDDEYRGHLLAAWLTGGVDIDVPEEAVIGTDDQVQMHWEGYGDTGSHIADPSAGNPRHFKIPRRAVPANMGKRLDVFYKVTPPGEQPYKSGVFDLEIKDIESGWPVLQINSPPASGNIISLATVTENDGVTFLLGSWTFMAPGQRVRIYANGVLPGGGEEAIDLRTGDEEVVTQDEYNAGKLFATLPRSFLEKLQIGNQFDVFVKTSFDEGFSYKGFPLISPQLIA